MGKRLIFLIVGLLMFIGGLIWLGSSTVKSIKCTEKVQAEVVDYEISYSRDSDGHEQTYYHMVVEYKVNGKKYTQTNGVGEGTKKISVGSYVTVKYNPKNPDQFMIKGHSGAYIFPLVLLFFGIVFTLASLRR